MCSKHAVKCIKVRMVPIWNKKQAVLRFLRKDVADLIAAGHEANAFRRVPFSLSLFLSSLLLVGLLVPVNQKGNKKKTSLNSSHLLVFLQSKVSAMILLCGLQL